MDKLVIQKFCFCKKLKRIFFFSKIKLARPKFLDRFMFSKKFNGQILHLSCPEELSCNGIHEVSFYMRNWYQEGFVNGYKLLGGEVGCYTLPVSPQHQYRQGEV